jgi:hypothetical protein
MSTYNGHVTASVGVTVDSTPTLNYSKVQVDGEALEILIKNDVSETKWGVDGSEAEVLAYSILVQEIAAIKGTLYAQKHAGEISYSFMQRVITTFPLPSGLGKTAWWVLTSKQVQQWIKSSEPEFYARTFEN